MFVLGEKQAQVLRLLEDGPTSVNRLIWTLAVESGRVQDFRSAATLPPEDEELPRSEYESVQRAIRSLVKRGDLLVSKRRPSAEHLREHYPYRSRSARFAFLRHKLLGALFAYASRMSYRNRPGPRYSVAENEQHVIGQMSTAQTAALRACWRVTEERLRELEAGSSQADAEAIFQIRVKCAELCADKPRFEHRDSLATLLANARRGEPGIRGREGIAAAEALYAFLPAEEMSRAALKTGLYAATDLDRSTGPRIELTSATKEALLRADPELVSSLPGFGASAERSQVPWKMNDRRSTAGSGFREYHALRQPAHFQGDLLDRFLGKDIFRPFHFVRLSP